MFKLLETLALTHDMPESGLRRGDLGAIVELHAPDAVDFSALPGRTWLGLPQGGAGVGA